VGFLPVILSAGVPAGVEGSSREVGETVVSQAP